MVDVTLLDGGMGQELVHRAGDAPTKLWSTRIMLDRPGLVAEVHRDFIKAGATVMTTNTYAIFHDRLAGTGLEDQFQALHRMALDEAHAAREEGIVLAGAIGPLGGSYRPELHPGLAEAAALYAEKARLIGPEVDLIICETVASLTQARAVLQGAAEGGKPVWLAVTVDDEDGRLLRSGEPVSEVCAIARDGGASAVLVNCCAPEAIGAALGELAAAGLPLGAYANGFTMITKDFIAKGTVDNLSPRRDMGPDAYAAFALDWVNRGATIVGGCCEVGPDHIARMATVLRSAGHVVV